MGDRVNQAPSPLGSFIEHHGSPAAQSFVEAQVDRNFFGPTAMRKKGFRFSQLGLVFGVPAYFVINQAGQVVERGNGSRYPATLPPILARLRSEKSL